MPSTHQVRSQLISLSIHAVASLNKSLTFQCHRILKYIVIKSTRKINCAINEKRVLSLTVEKNSDGARAPDFATGRSKFPPYQNARGASYIKADYIMDEVVKSIRQPLMLVGDLGEHVWWGCNASVSLSCREAVLQHASSGATPGSGWSGPRPRAPCRA